MFGRRVFIFAMMPLGLFLKLSHKPKNEVIYYSAGALQGRQKQTTDETITLTFKMLKIMTEPRPKMGNIFTKVGAVTGDIVVLTNQPRDEGELTFSKS
jgi:hypothetical protein